MPPNETRAYDVFFSYNRDSSPSVREIAEALGTRGLRVWLDQSDVIPGERWQDALNEISSNVAAAAIFLGQEGLGPWQTQEMQSCIDQFVKRSLRVIPVVLPGLKGEPQLPVLLSNFRWVDLRTNPMESALDQLEWGIRGTKVDAVGTAPSKPDLRKVLSNLPRELERRAQRGGAAQSATTVPPYNKQFSGRVEELIELRGRLKNDGAGVICGVHGLGGVGKTELAFMYAHAFADDYRGGQFLVECEGKPTLRDALLGTGTFAQLDFIRDGVSEEERTQPDTYFAAIGRCLRARLSSHGPILLVLDNVADANLLAPEQTDRLTMLGPTLHLLATTRLPAGTATHVSWTSLDELPEADAVALLEKHRAFADDGEREGATKIVRRLRGFPLAVELVGAWLAAHPSATYAGLADGLGLDDLDQFAEDKDVELRRHNDERRLQSVLGSTLAGLSPAERLAVEYAACLAPDHVALPWLRELVVAEFPELRQTGRLGAPWEELCSRLQLLGIFTRAEGEGHRARIVRIHRLVQDVVRRMLSQAELSDREKAIETLIAQRDTALNETTKWEQARWELEPLDAVASLWADNDASNAAWLLNQVGQRWANLAEWGRAEPLMRRALAIDESSYGPQHSKVAIRLNNLAALLQATNRLDEAEPLMRRTLAIDESSYGPQHPEVAIDLNNLVALLQATNRLAEAEPLIRRALAIDEASYGPQHSKVAIRLNNLAQLLQGTNRLAEAEPLMRRALAIDESSYGPQHPKVGIRLNNLAALLRTTNRLAEAEPLIRRALAIDESSYGPQHPTVAIRLNNLAMLLQATNRLAEAEPLMHRALGIDESSFGPQHPKVALRLSNLAQLLQDTNRLAEAEPLMHRALGIDEASFGRQHPKVAIRLNNLAQLLKDTNRLGEAEPLSRRSVEIFLEFVRSTGHKHPHQDAAFENYAEILKEMGRDDQEVQAELAALAAKYGVSVP